jgi:hypothetical protein
MTLSTAAAVPLDTPREAMAPARKAVPAPPAEVTPRTLRKLTGNVRTSVLSEGRHWHAQPNHARDSPLRALAPCHPEPQLARAQERCRTRADGVEIFLHACSRDRAGSRMRPVICFCTGVDLDGLEPPAASLSVLGGHGPRCDPTGVGGCRGARRARSRATWTATPTASTLPPTKPVRPNQAERDRQWSRG